MARLDNRPRLPDIIPQEDVSVTGEQHTYKTFDVDSGTQDQLEYTLNKAPVDSINSVSGISRDGNSRTFSNGVDYVLSDKVVDRENSFTFDESVYRYELSKEPDTNTIVVTDENGFTYDRGTDYQVINPDGAAADTIRFDPDETIPTVGTDFTATYRVTFPDSNIEWLPSGNNLPEPGRPFFVSYTAPSVIGRYLDVSENALDGVEDDLRLAIDNKFVDRADLASLEELGNLFGPLIGKRRGRSKEQYRIYLRSVVQSFISRGNVNGIKLAISAATDVPIEDITINENFDQNSYQVVVQANTPVQGSLLEEIAEIADPSGVEQESTRFTIGPPDEMGVDDEVSDLSESRDAGTDEVQSDDAITTSTSAVAFWDASGVAFDDGDDWAGENN